MTICKIQATFFFLSLLTSGIDAHGYLKTPRSRNIVAYEEGADSGSDPDVYLKEYCPHCLNRGGTLGRCGNTGLQNYDTPLSTAGTIMPADPQIVASRGDQITVDIGLTAHHKGHFEFKACPVSSPAEAPSQECFDEHVLTLVEDVFYGSLPDPNYPERAYIPQSTYPDLRSDTTLDIGASLYRYTLQLPADVVGDLVLLQWRYLTANSCVFLGYDTYDFPSAWGDMNYNGLALCQDPLPADGNGTPEQFWNCAEMAVVDGPVEPTTSAPISAPSPLNPPVPYPTEAPIYFAPPAPDQPTSPVPAPISNTPCGSGNVGNGICADPTLCCSEWGWCGSTPQHCAGSPTQQPSQSPTPAPIMNLTPTMSPTPLPTNPPVNSPSQPCCPEGYFGLRAWNNCFQYYHCVNGVVTGGLVDAPAGTLFDQNIQNFNWEEQVTCVVDDC